MHTHHLDPWTDDDPPYAAPERHQLVACVRARVLSICSLVDPCPCDRGTADSKCFVVVVVVVSSDPLRCIAHPHIISRVGITHRSPGEYYTLAGRATGCSATPVNCHHVHYKKGCMARQLSSCACMIPFTHPRTMHVLVVIFFYLPAAGGSLCNNNQSMFS